MAKTNIEWADDVWNPVRGCSRISEGCRHCYAEKMAGRIVAMGKGKPTKYDGLVKVPKLGDVTMLEDARWTGTVAFDATALADPLKWRKPRRVFVNSMSDLFHERLTNEQIAAVFGVMAAGEQHQFIVLTKRARRMREWFEWMHKDPQWAALRCQEAAIQHGAWIALLDPVGYSKLGWPLPNVILGVSVENQAAADERIPDLLATPAAVRAISAEPLLGPLDLSAPCPPNARPFLRSPDRISWVIAGCESGPGARPCEVAWLRSLRDQCKKAGTAFFLKQAKDGCGCPSSHRHNDTEGCESCSCTWSAGDGRVGSVESGIAAGPCSTRKPGGIIGLPYLDGVQHAAFPEVKS